MRRGTRSRAVKSTWGYGQEGSITRISSRVAQKTPVRYKSLDGLLILDLHGRVMFANAMARKLLDLTDKEVRGQPCFELFAGHDVHGNRFCFKNCAVMKMARRQEPVRHLNLEVTTRSGKKQWCSITTLLQLDPAVRGEPSIIHIFRRIQHPQVKDEPPARHRRLDAVSRLESASVLLKKFPLSPRQAEILVLLTQGLVAKEIGVHLSLSTATVRTHIQHILRKLGVHSKLEAVALVLRQQRI